jgi:ATP-dependent helicase/nuclease subunit B
VLYRGEQQSEAVMAGAAGAAAVVVAEGWTQQLQQWREVLERLAQEFRRGEVGVTPLQGRSSCQYCGLEPLCRVEW